MSTGLGIVSKRNVFLPGRRRVGGGGVSTCTDAMHLRSVYDAEAQVRGRRTADILIVVGKNA